MSKPDRTTARALKALRHAATESMDAREAKASARIVRRADRRARHSRAEYLASLRMADLMAEA